MRGSSIQIARNENKNILEPSEILFNFNSQFATKNEQINRIIKIEKFLPEKYLNVET